MLHNYHTHTWRCHHATGTEREYIENAISMGMKTLGFSDHAPWDYFDGHASSTRMETAELCEYVKTLSALREEYKDRIDVRIGLEAEYYLPYFDRFLEEIEPFSLDYLLLGQHTNGCECDFRANSLPTDKEEDLSLYVSQVLAALYTGRFSCLAHPDFLRFTGDDVTYRRYMLPFCREIRRMNIPVELNLLGVRDHRHYPSDRFFQIVAEAGNTVVLGMDAHSPDVITDTETEKTARAFLARFGITPLETMTLRPPTP